MSRNYSIKEIDELRYACEKMWLFGTTKQTDRMCSRAYREEEKNNCVENLVRTYMIAGKTAQDLYDSEYT